jgi:hypothetical protein
MSPNELEALWRSRLREAHLRLEFARNFLKGVQRDLRLSEPSPDGRYAYRRAIRLEYLARQEYRHLQPILFDLTVNGKVPDEEEWQRRMAPGAGLM